MTALEDRRPVAATTTASDNPSVIGEDLAHLLVEHPDIELASVRLIPNKDGTVGIAGRRGELAGVDCPQCHTPVGRPHTEYCTLSPWRVWYGVLPGACTSSRRDYDQTPLDCATPERHDAGRGSTPIR